MKKAQGLSLNTIIIAAIALVVLIVLWAIFTGRMGVFSTGLQEVEKNCNDQCVAAGYARGSVKDLCATGEIDLRAVTVKGATQRCCCTTS